MADYRHHHEAPIRAHERGRAGAGDHPLSDGRLANALGARPQISRVSVIDPPPVHRERMGKKR